MIKFFNLCIINHKQNKYGKQKDLSNRNFETEYSIG